jgi:hypothetical protein
VETWNPIWSTVNLFHKCVLRNFSYLFYRRWCSFVVHNNLLSQIEIHCCWANLELSHHIITKCLSLYFVKYSKVCHRCVLCILPITKRSRGSVAGNARFFSSPQLPNRLWCPPSLLANGYRGLFPWGKAVSACSRPLISTYCRGQERWSYTSTPPHMSSWHSAWLFKHIKNVTFIIFRELNFEFIISWQYIFYFFA